jgi:hypothetical protein
MTRKSENTAASLPSETPPFSVQATPKLVILNGRGHAGKTFIAQWIIDRAHVQGRAIVVADADPTNGALAAYFDDVSRPPSADQDDVEDWAVQLIEKLTIEGFNAIVDSGAGNPIWKLLNRKLDFADYAKKFGVEFVAIYLFTPDIDDLAIMRDLEESGFAPEATILALNEGVVPGHKSFATAFKPVLEHPVFKAARQRGAQTVAIPKLSSAAEITLQRLTMSAAERGESKLGRPPLGPITRQFITTWLRDMERNFEHVAHWLP